MFAKIEIFQDQMHAAHKQEHGQMSSVMTGLNSKYSSLHKADNELKGRMVTK